MVGSQITRRGLVKQGAAAAAGALVPGLAERAWAAAAAVPGGALVIGSEGQHQTMDPHVLTGTVTLRITALIYENLITQDMTHPELKYVPLAPGVAQSWTASEDGTTYTFHLRTGVRFHDGTPLNAAAVKANFDRALDPSSPFYYAPAKGNLNFIMRWVDHTEAPNPWTFVIHLKEPFPSLAEQLADRRMGLISPAALQKWGNADIGAHPVGSGPFRFASKSTDNTVTVERAPDYWGTKPYLDRIIFRPYPDPTALGAALQTGDVDVVISLTVDQLTTLLKDPTVQVQYTDLPNVFFWMLNTKTGPTTSKAVRQAFNYAINRGSISADLLKGSVRPCGGPVPVGNPVYEPSLFRYDYNPAKAKALLAEAKVPVPLEITVMLPTSGAELTDAPAVGLVMQQNLRDVGVNVTFERMEWAAFLAKAIKGLDDSTAALYTGWDTGTQDPYWFETMFSGASVPPNGPNRAWYSDPKVDQLLSAARHELNPTQRIATYRKAAGIIVEDAPWIFLFQPPQVYVTGKNVNNLVFYPTDLFLRYQYFSKT